MREMKDSGVEWIGQIPERWQLRRAKTLFTQRNSKGNKVEVLLSPTQKYGVVPQSQLEGVVQVKEDTDLQMFKTIHKGDFVISLRSFQGGFEYSLYEGVCSPAYQVFYPITPICDLYYRYLFKSQSFISKMNNLTVGIREGKNIQYIDFANSQIPVPPIAEQERIAAFLDAECAEIDAVLEKTRASIEEYKKLKQAVITQAVTKGVRGDRPMKDSGIEWIGEIPAEWGGVPHKRIMHKVKEICEQYNGEDIISLTVNGVVKRDLTAGGKMPTSFDGYQYVEPNNLLLCLFDIDVTPRCVGVVRDYGVTSPAYSRFVMHDGYYNAYYDYLLRMIDDNKVFVHLSKNLRSSLTESDFGAIKTCAPPLAEQKCIAAFLDVRCDEIDALIAKKQQYLTEIENYKKSLIYEYVTGKKEVV